MALHERLITYQTALVLHLLLVDREELAMADLLASLSKSARPHTLNHRIFAAEEYYALQHPKLR